MARYCSQCNRKLGFLEEDFDGKCKSCYDKSLRRIETDERLEEKK